MAGSSSYPVVVHQDRPSKSSASISSNATRSSAKSRPSSISSNDSYISTGGSSMWSDANEAALIEKSKSRVNKQTGKTVTVWNSRS
ncbi:hypothetical protein N0V93_002943 [Gnomoniopsis smithogilvyi]|uniref:Uncharacterized protein n=1 Tax=Gnomoniopsis smithogilvyi TaxID=1191159 RepID=A0A9W8YXM2_9PEZI|nr:hypothetical protein N0V93_002943 [Gnomoniopsis smithogilvyi]